MPSLSPSSQIWPCSSSGTSSITMSPSLAASAGSSTFSPCSSALATLLEPGRSPTTTLTPESLRFSAWAWPWEP